MIHAIRCYQPVNIPGRTSLNMVSIKQLPDLLEIIRAEGGFVIMGKWNALWGDKRELFNIFVPDANVQYAYITDIHDTKIKEMTYNASKFTLTELKSLAKARGVETSGKTKNDLVNELNALGF